MARFRRIPVVIEAEQATEPGTVNTPEGPMAYKADDWLITGVEGEVYACKDSVFQKTYENIDLLPDYGTLKLTRLPDPPSWYMRLWRWVMRQWREGQKPMTTVQEYNAFLARVWQKLRRMVGR